MKPFCFGSWMIVCLLLPLAASAAPTSDQLENIWDMRRLKTSEVPSAVELRSIPIELRGAAASGAPLTFGVPLPKDEIHRVDQMRLVDSAGRPVDCSIVPTATWTAGGSLKWVLLDVAAPGDLSAGDDKPLQPWTLQYGRAVQAQPIQRGITVREDDSQITLDTGRVQATFSKRHGSVIEALRVDGQVMLDAARRDAGLYFVDQAGRTFRSDADDPDYRIEVEFHTPMRAVVKATGWYIDESGQRACRYITRIYLHRDQPMLRVFTTWIITVDTDTMRWRDIGLRLGLPVRAGASVAVGTDPADTGKHIKATLDGEPLVVSQTAADRGQTRVGGKPLWQGKSIGNWLDVAGDDWGGVTMASPDLAGHFPAGFSVEPGAIRLHAFSPDAGHLLGFGLQDLKDRYGPKAWQRFNEKLYKDPPYEARKSQGIGLAKTHEWVLMFRPAKQAGDVQAMRAAVDQMLRPALAMASPQWNCQSGAFGPYHPHDPQRFEALENRVSHLLDEWIDATRRMDPHYGFYDHGRGVPYHLQREGLPDGSHRYVYSGYRRNYDLGYGNPIVPWLMYLRSGDRRWLDVGVAKARHEMDVRHIHPTYAGGTPRIGFKFWHYGSWSFDQSCLGFQDMWYKNLALCFYTTGYQRAMEVYGEIMESVHDAYMVRKSFPLYVPNDRTGRTSTAGSVAAYYKATWDPRFRALYEALTPSVLAEQRIDGIYQVRIPWMEQFFQESLYDMPDPLPEVVKAYDRLCKAFILTPGRSDQEQFAPFAHWWWHRQHQDDPIVAAYARKYLARYLDERYNLIGSFGMRELLYLPMWQSLELVEGGTQAQLPQSVQISLPGERPIHLQHRHGRPTWANFAYLGEAMEAFDEQGRPLSWLTFDPSIFLYQLRVPAEAPTQRITIRATPSPIMRDKNDWPRLPWWPERDRAVLTWQGENPLVDTPIDPPTRTWELPIGEDARFPAGLFGRSVRLSADQRLEIDLGQASENGHVRRAFDSRQGTIEFFIRFEGPTFGDLLVLPIEGGDNSAKPYEQTLWVRLGSYWDARMYNRQGLRQYLVYRQQPRIIPGRWHHVAIVWDWNDLDPQPAGRKPRKNDQGKIIARLFLDGSPGPKVDGGADDSRTYWLNTGELPLPARILRLGQDKPFHAVSIDELRISSTMRYPFGKLSEKTFDPPALPFELDEHTLLLHHFDQAGDGLGQGGSPVPVRYISPGAR